MKNVILAMSFVLAASSLLVFGQAEQVKKRAKDLKRNVESGQTNSVPRTNAPPRSP